MVVKLYFEIKSIKRKTISSWIRTNQLVYKVSAKYFRQGIVLILYIKNKARARVLILYQNYHDINTLMHPYIATCYE